MQQIQIPVEGMTCGGCVASVQRALGRVEAGSVAVTFDAAAVDLERLVSVIDDAGYSVPEVWLTERREAASMRS